MKTSHPTRKPNRSMDPVAVAQPAIEAALPAKPPMTIFEALLRLSQAVYTNDVKEYPNSNHSSSNWVEGKKSNDN